ncbi:shikimate dehydrogenase [Frankia sp. CNm7]|uniref:Shikimate dehydrogenase n=1 Tax=Frankia nepalensis TaxID=1836974 RepID=A0A937RDU6_9ACTN|nr:shikimate dehydrogenase [Frankia nepalensis]MBL7502207.1 shikimate dehydrogenase [Frankia nepalensis]MBL7513480.1 shikimate dehydrogenase [Frankia nepalensis]MBL7522636.1 shikimate dehydrogenase [Frankia nepalensis]MBL7630336.1 shikimate dehydrogenase [Frankia nepalensis]
MNGPRQAAVLGSPIGHSLSPVLHRAAYQALGLSDWTYTAINTDEAALPSLLTWLRSEPSWAGLSLTMPLKTAAVGLVDRLDDTAALVGAVNTVVVEPDGTLAGHNTDIAGIRYAVLQALGAIPALAHPEAAPLAPGSSSAAGLSAAGSSGAGWQPSHWDGSSTWPALASPPVRALVLGAGGTARAAVAALASVGVRRVGVVARRAAAVAPLAQIGERVGLAVTALPWEIVAGGLRSGPDLVIATTPEGVTDQIAEWTWPAGCPLVELLYHPWPTALAVTAYRSGARVSGGLVVLAAQAVEQVRLFTGRTVDVATLLTAGTQTLTRRATAASLTIPTHAR